MNNSGSDTDGCGALPIFLILVLGFIIIIGQSLAQEEKRIQENDKLCREAGGQWVSVLCRNASHNHEPLCMKNGQQVLIETEP